MLWKSLSTKFINLFCSMREKIPVLDNISLTVPHGQCTALLGPSGCGKSTLLSMIAGFYPPDSGSITTTGKVSLCMQKRYAAALARSAG